MTNSIRNTIILILTLLLFAGGGSYLIDRYFSGEIEETNERLTLLKRDRDYLTEITEMYPTVEANYYDAVYSRENHPKELFSGNNTSQIYNYLHQLNTGNATTQLNFSYIDSLQRDNYGIVNFTVRGEGRYQNLMNFIYRIEFSRPLIQVNSINFGGISDAERLDRVTFEISMGAYYRRGDWSEFRAIPEMILADGERVHNPYYPLIHSVPPNTDNLLDVENSRLVVLRQNRVHISDQNGRIQQLAVGDRVYLGRLSSINMARGEVTFNMNRGGIADRYVLSLEQDNP